MTATRNDDGGESQTVEFVILGAGLCGLAAASKLGARAAVLEREETPGGVVRTERLAGHWIDRVIHMLYFDRPEKMAQISGLFGDVLASSPPVAWIETAAGAIRYPMQHNLHDLPADLMVACLYDLAAAHFHHSDDPAKDYRDFLMRQFGKTLCELFFFPYNEKLWGRPLDKLAPTSFQWNIARPVFKDTLAAAIARQPAGRAYNDGGFYPRPPPDAPVRGAEFMARMLAEHVIDLRLQHRVEAVDLRARTIHVATPWGPRRIVYRFACLSTLPLPSLLDLVCNLPPEVAQARAALKHNRVVSIAFALRGPRPERLGCWRYYPDPSLVFTRAVFMHEFDPLMSPPDGWSILVEIPQPAEDPVPDLEGLMEQAWRDLHRTTLPLAGCELVARSTWIIDPAYVVFTPETEGAVRTAKAFLIEHGVDVLGRYGQWEYSSMVKVMTDGFAYAEFHSRTGHRHGS